MQDKGRPVEAFSRYVMTVCENNESMGTWENLRHTVEELEKQKQERQTRQEKPETQAERISIEPENKMTRAQFEKIKKEMLVA
jgi:hypothetical protein